MLLVQGARSSSSLDIVGNILYLAPEQLKGEHSPTCDQYALAVITYEWLCGSRLFDGTFIEVGKQHLHSPVPSLRANIPSLSLEIEQIVQKALAKDPARRFESIKAFARAFESACRPQAFPPFSLSNVLGVFAVGADAPLLTPTQVPSLVWPTANAASGATLPVVALNSCSCLCAVHTNADFSLCAAHTDADPASTAHVDANAEPTERDISAWRSHADQGAATIQSAYGNASQHENERRAASVGLCEQAPAAASRYVPAAFLAAHRHRGLVGPGRTRGCRWRHCLVSATAAHNSDGQHALYIHGAGNQVLAVAWQPAAHSVSPTTGAPRIASGSLDHTVQVWDAFSGDHAFTYKGHNGAVEVVAWSPDNDSRIASGSTDRQVQVWDASAGQRLLTYTGHTDGVLSLSWSPDGKYIASAGKDATVQVWDTHKGHLLFAYHGHKDWIGSVAWSPDGKYIASASADKTVQVIDARKGHHIVTYTGHTDKVWAIAWASDSQRLASGGDDHTVQVWQATTGHHIYTYNGHSSPVETVAWSPNGPSLSSRIASGSEDRTVQVWDPAAPENSFTYSNHFGTVWDIAWSPDGTHIASASLDHTVQVWQAV